jgi:uroporphyrinogen-III synthase
MFFSPSAVESYLSNNNKKKYLLHMAYNGSLEGKKLKIVIPEIPLSDVIIEVIQYNTQMPEEGN